MLARVDTVGPVIARLALVWADEAPAVVRAAGAEPRSEARPGHTLSPGLPALSLAQVDAWFAGWVETQEFTPPPPGFEVLTPQSLTKHAKKKADPNLAEPYFDACGDLWDQLQTLQRDLRVAALLDAAAFARDQVELAKERAQALGYDDLLTGSTRPSTPRATRPRPWRRPCASASRRP